MSYYPELFTEHGICTFKISYCTCKTLPDIPEQTEKLCIVKNKKPLQIRVPDHIKFLILDSCNNITIEYLSKNLNTLYIINCSIQTLPQLPPLTHLVLNKCSMLQNIEAFPISLIYLCLCNLPLSQLPPLPALLSLSINGCKKIQTITLPPTLQFLRLKNMNIAKLPILPNLSQLHIEACENIKELPALPETLKILECIYLQLTYLPYWPETLNHMNFMGGSVDSIIYDNDDGEYDRNEWNACVEIMSCERCNVRCKNVKEELMTRTWATERLMDWCFDEEEKMEWRRHE